MAATDNPDTETSPVTIEKKGPGILLIIVGVLVFLLVVAVGGFVGYTQLPKVAAKYSGDGAPVTEQRVNRLEVKEILTLEPFLVNLADEDDIRFLKATFQLGMAEVLKPEQRDANSMEIATIRDSILSLLCSKTADHIATAEGKETLREEIRVTINERLPKNRIAEVFIVDFVIQF